MCADAAASIEAACAAVVESLVSVTSPFLHFTPLDDDRNVRIQWQPWAKDAAPFIDTLCSAIVRHLPTPQLIEARGVPLKPLSDYAEDPLVIDERRRLDAAISRVCDVTQHLIDHLADEAHPLDDEVLAVKVHCGLVPCAGSGGGGGGGGGGARRSTYTIFGYSVPTGAEGTRRPRRPRRRRRPHRRLRARPAPPPPPRAPPRRSAVSPALTRTWRS